MNRRLTAAAWGAAVAFLVVYAVTRSVGRTTNGFVAYYGAARLFVEGRLGAWVYDDARFTAFIKELTHTNVLEIYGPNSPAMALLALPFAWLGPNGARTAWLAVSILAVVGAAAVVIADRWRREGELPFGAVFLMLVTPSVVANLRNAQAYLFVTAFYAAAALALMGNRDVLAGAALGLGFALKSAGLPFLALAAFQKRFRAVATAAGIVAACAALVIWRSGLAMWPGYVAYVLEFVRRPSASVTASQTTYSLFRHLCVQDPQWNPFPAANCAQAATVAPPALIFGAFALTAWTSRRAAAPDWIAAALCLCALDVPTAEDPHFAILGIPAVMLMARWRGRKLAGWSPWVLYGALMFVPLGYTARRFQDGWSALLAYPRLYAAWLLWAMAMREMLTASLPARHLAIEPREGARGPVGVVRHGPLPCLRPEATAPLGVFERRRDGAGDVPGRRRAHRDRADAVPVRDVADVGADRRDAARGGFERHDAGRFVTRGEHRQVRALVKRDELARRLEPVKRHGRIEAEGAGETLHLPVERVFADHVEVNIEAARAENLQRAEEQRLILDAVQTGRVDQPPRRPFDARGKRREERGLDAERNHIDGDSPCSGERRLIVAAYRDASGESRGGRDGQAVTPYALLAVRDCRNRHELAAVERGDSRHAQPPGSDGGVQARRERPIRVDDVEGAVRHERGVQRRLLPEKAGRPAQVVHARAKQVV